MILPFPDGCPPDDAEPREGDFYVLGEKNLQPGDVPGRMTWQRPYEKPRGEYYQQTDDCNAHSLSVFEDLSDIHRAREFSPFFRQKSIAVVGVTTRDGWFKRVPTVEGDSHHNWWTNPYDLIPNARVIEAKCP